MIIIKAIWQELEATLKFKATRKANSLSNEIPSLIESLVYFNSSD